MLAPELIHTFFSARYAPSVLLLQVSIAGLLFSFLYFPFGAVLNSTKHQTTNTIILGLTTALNALINWLLIPRFEGLGASIAQVTSNVFLVVASGIIARQAVPLVRAWWTRMAKVLLAGILMAATLLAKHIMLWPIAMVLSMAVFAFVMWKMQVLEDEDLIMVRKCWNYLCARLHIGSSQS